MCKSVGLWPDAVFSGHAHVYQRFTRLVGSKETPYVVSGSGGFAATAPRAQLPPAPITVGDHTLEIDPIVAFGYGTVTTDAQTLSIIFKTATASGVAVRDSVTVDLKSGNIISGDPVQGTTKSGGKKSKPPKKPKGPKKRK